MASSTNNETPQEIMIMSREIDLYSPTQSVTDQQQLLEFPTEMTINSEHVPSPSSSSSSTSSMPFEITKSSAWGEVSSPLVNSPWGTRSPVLNCSETSFKDLMSEDLAKDLQDKDNQSYSNDASIGDANPDKLLELTSSSDTTDDFMLARVLQYQFDKEYDHQLQREQKQINGNSKVSVTFDKFKICPSWYGEGSDDEDEDLDEDNRDLDSFQKRQRQEAVVSSRGYTRHGNKMVTKHDPEICGRKNAERIMSLPPGINTGDGGSFDMQLSNKVYNKLHRSAIADMKRKQRVHDKEEKATAIMALDAKTRLLIFKLVNSGVLEAVDGIISTGKEAIVLFAQGGMYLDVALPDVCAVKVFKTTLTDFKTREKYIKDDYRFKDRMAKSNSRILIQRWAEKEYHNLRRLQHAGISSPKPILIKKYVLVMSFIGNDRLPAPKLKEVILSHADWCIAYEQVVEGMVKMFSACRLVHADLSEYNILWHEEKCWFIDLGQAVEPTHANALKFLYRDCANIIRFFKSKKIPELPLPSKLFEKITGIPIPGPECEALLKLEEYEISRTRWCDGMNNVGDQFEFLWNEIQNDEMKHKQNMNSKLEDEDILPQYNDTKEDGEDYEENLSISLNKVALNNRGLSVANERLNTSRECDNNEAGGSSTTNDEQFSGIRNQIRKDEESMMRPCKSKGLKGTASSITSGSHRNHTPQSNKKKRKGKGVVNSS